MRRGYVKTWVRGLGAAALLATGVLFSAGCPTGSGRFSLEIRSPEAGDARNTIVAYGSPLGTGDRYSANIVVKEPLYVYVEQRSPEGIAPLWPGPNGSMHRVFPGQPLTVPPGGFLKRQAQPGSIYIYVVASTQMLTIDQARFEIDKAQGPMDSGTLGSTRRGDAMASSDLNEQGTGVLRFEIGHR
jgi:hypothetical protein